MKRSILLVKTLVVGLVMCLPLGQLAQAQISSGQLGGTETPISTAVAFLTIAPDSKASAMGDVGAATDPDVFSQYWNVAKYAFIKNDVGAGISVVPWLRNLGLDDIYLANVAGYYRLDKRQALSASLRYFSLGDIQFTDNQGTPLNTHNPNEFSLDMGYSFLLSKKLSGGIAVRYIHSNLTGGQGQDGSESKPGQTVAMDVGAYYNTKIKVDGKDAKLAFGATVTNIGGKISYTAAGEQNFIPINMRLGGSFNYETDEYNAFTFSLDMNKLLVPTPQNRTDIESQTVAVAEGILHSFSDAPGGFSEEMHEITYSAGAEYLYAKLFAMRAGYFHEHESKGNRQYFTLGIGVKLNVIGIDLSYLVPRGNNQSPLANTMRFSLTFDVGAMGSSGDDVPPPQ